MSRPTPPPMPGPVPLPPNRSSDCGRIDRAQLETTFVELLRERWRRGAEAYGDASFRKPFAATAAEIECELLDIAGWSLIAWAQVRERLQGIASIEQLHARAVAAEQRVEDLHARIDAIATVLVDASNAPTHAGAAAGISRALRISRQNTNIVTTEDQTT